MEDQLVGVHEIAEMAGVTSAAVANWRTRALDFPSPVANLRAGPVFRLSDVRRWLRKKGRKPMANVISVINLKGGVGKSTTTVALAEVLASEFLKRVLVIDLDPQTNSTVMLIGEDRWEEQNDKHATLAQLFEDSLIEDRSLRKFSIDEALIRGVSNVASVRTLDLLPSSIDLIDVQDRLASMPSGRYFSNIPTEILRRATLEIIEGYDHVLIDCPPNLGIVTLNGLRMSNAYVIPTIPDHLSTYGIPQIVQRVEEFSSDIGESIEPLGIIISKFRAQSTVHQNTLARLRAKNDPPVFKTVISESDKIAASAEYAPISTLRQKYGYQGQFDTYHKLAKEFQQVAAVV